MLVTHQGVCAKNNQTVFHILFEYRGIFAQPSIVASQIKDILLDLESSGSFVNMDTPVCV